MGLIGKRIRGGATTWRRGLVWSILIHASLIVCIAMSGLLVVVPVPAPSVSTQVGPIVVGGTFTTHPGLKIADVATETGFSPTELSEEVNETTPQLSQLIRDQLDAQLQKSQAADPVELQKQLERAGQRLEAVSSTQGVADVGTTLSKTLGLGERNQPVGDTVVEGEFDHATGQIDDVRLVEVDGKQTYIALMVDAQGRRLEVELDEADGQQLYETFQMMKRFPFMESVYRGIVMGLMDKMLAEETRASEKDPALPTQSP